MNLRYRANKWDLYDAVGVASLYRKVGEYESDVSAQSVICAVIYLIVT